MPRQEPAASTLPTTAVAACLLVAVAFVVMWPALGAGFLQDDWEFLATSTHLPTPLPFFFENYSRAYYYRPNGMLVWWLANWAFGLASLWHYALQIVVHAGCALALLGLMRRLGASRVAANAAAFLFVVHPATLATSLWLSNRFDLLAALGLLLCLRLLFSPQLARPAACAGVAACAWLAVGAKEIGLLVVPLAALALWLRPDTGMRTRLAAAAAVALTTLAWFGLRLWVLGNDDVTSQRDLAVLSEQVKAGVGLWLRHLPEALALGAPAWLGALVLSVLLAAALAALPRGRSDSLARRAWLGLAMMFLPPLLQWPITHFTLALPDPLSFTVSLRFYFLTVCGAAILLSVAIDWALARGEVRSPASPLPRVVAMTAATVAWAVMAVHGHQRSSNWTAATADPQALKMEASLAQQFRSLARGAGCKLVFEGASTLNLPGYADHIAKTHLPPGHIAVDSLVVTDPMSWAAIVGPAGAEPRALAPLPNRMTGPLELVPSRVGPVYFVSLSYRPEVLADGQACPPLSLRWDGSQFVPLSPSPATSPAAGPLGE